MEACEYVSVASALAPVPLLRSLAAAMPGAGPRRAELLALLTALDPGPPARPPSPPPRPSSFAPAAPAPAPRPSPSPADIPHASPSPSPAPVPRASAAPAAPSPPPRTAPSPALRPPRKPRAAIPHRRGRRPPAPPRRPACRAQRADGSGSESAGSDAAEGEGAPPRPARRRPAAPLAPGGAAGRPRQGEAPRHRLVIPLFILPPDSEEGGWPLGGAARYWLEQSLGSLEASLREEYGSRLVVRRGASEACLLALVEEAGAGAVFCNRLYEPWKIRRDEGIAGALRARGVDPEASDAARMGYGSVGFFLAAVRAHERAPAEPLPKPAALARPASWPASVPIAELGLYRMPLRRGGGGAAGERVDWAAGIRERWGFGEDAARRALARFLREGLRAFEARQSRFRADARNTAEISPYMRFGELGPRTVYHEAQKAAGPRFQPRTFLRRLAWRDLAYWALWAYPELPDRALRPWYESQWWAVPSGGPGAALRLAEAPAALRAWQRGQTGYPLVDAGMRQLWRTGWMPNYMRHVVAGFLVEFLNADWRHGERWFHDTLVDADLAINAFMWQNGGHSGFDQWNFVMHPVFAAKACDPEGHYVRRWCPELAGLPVEYIHCPWEAPLTLAAAAGVVLGRTYPRRIVEDLDAARQRAHEAVLAVRRGPGRPHVLPSGHERLGLAGGGWAVLITRVDYREAAETPVTRQTAEKKWDKSKRDLTDTQSLAMRGFVRAFASGATGRDDAFAAAGGDDL
eukprot:tig00021579_g22443.t1